MLLAASLAAAAVLVPAPAALGHTHLDGSVPADGARLRRPPSTVELTFDDPVDDRLSTAELIGPDARRQPLALAARPAPASLVFALPAAIPAGEAIVTYRALSTDGHAAVGAIVFASAISARAAAGADTRARARAAAARAQLAGRPWAATRVLAGVVFVVLAWHPAGGPAGRADLELVLARRWRRLAAAATVAGAASAACALAAQTAVATGTGAALTFRGAGAVMATRAGAAWLLALLAWAAVALVLVATQRRPRHPRTLLALILPLTLLTIVPATSGHAGRSAPLAIANVVHVCAVSAWLGGLVALLVATRALTAGSPAAREQRLLGALVARFAVVAAVAVTALAATGTAQSALLLGGIGDLASTGYGRLLSVKIALTLVVLGLGARQRRALVHRSSALAGTARAELALGLLLLATTALLAGEAAHG